MSSALLQPQHGLPDLQLLLAGQQGVMAVLRCRAQHSSVAKLWRRLLLSNAPTSPPLCTSFCSGHVNIFCLLASREPVTPSVFNVINSMQPDR